MGSVLALDEFRHAIKERENRRPVRIRPVIRGAEIWERDYTQIEAVVFGLLKVRDILTYHLGASDSEFDHHCMDALKAAYLVQDLGTARLKAAIKPIKECLLDIITEDNKREISWALVLIDLIEKAPTV